MNEAQENSVPLTPYGVEMTKTPIDCDKVSELNSILFRFAEVIREPKPRTSKAQKTARLSALLEIMEVLGLRFADNDARHNAIFDFTEIFGEGRLFEEPNNYLQESEPNF